MKRTQLAGLSLLSALLLFASWPVSPLTALIFIAWVPLLWLADLISRKSVFFGYTYLTVLLWNIGTTWWIWNSSDIGTIAAIGANSLFMCLPWWGYHIFKKKYGRRIGYGSLILFWMCFEYIHLNWQLSWPWLTLGNVFASHPDWVQWYEYTGVGGGSLLILIGNLLFFELSMAARIKNNTRSLTRLCLLIISIPILMYGFCQLHYLRSSQLIEPKHNIVIIQPNIDPYQKLSSSTVSDQIAKLTRLSEEAVDSATELVIWPETAMIEAELPEKISSNFNYQPVFTFVNKHPGITLLSGIETYKTYGTIRQTATARKSTDGIYYDEFNAAVSIKKNTPSLFYNKSKLVPGVESLPTFLNFMAPVFEKFGGTAGGYGKSDESAVFAKTDNEYITAPIICYESIYGEYVSSYVQKGANILTIMTNDGWWGNTAGHKQHLQYARLRAIETRRWVARSANTGISAVIDENGKILQTQPWDTAAFIKYPIPVVTGQTFYVKYGDYIYKLASLIAVLLIGWHLAKMIQQKFLLKKG